MAGQGRRLTLAPRGRKQSCLAGQYSLPPHRSAPGRVGLPPPSPQLSMAAQFVDQGREHAIVDETSAGIDLLRCRVIPPAGLVGRMPQFLSAPIHHEEFNGAMDSGYYFTNLMSNGLHDPMGYAAAKPYDTQQPDDFPPVDNTQQLDDIPPADNTQQLDDTLQADDSQQPDETPQGRGKKKTYSLCQLG